MPPSTKRGKNQELKAIASKPASEAPAANAEHGATPAPAETAANAEYPDDGGKPNARPQRTCAVTRLEKPIDDLIRFVCDPTGTIIPDLARRLPGRGVWVSLARDKVAQAAARNVFARSLKRQVEVDKNLPSQVEVLLLKRVGDALGLANKAGLIVPGFAQVDSAIESVDFAALLHGSDAASQGREKLDRKLKAIAKVRQIEPIIADPVTIDQMSLALGRPNVVHALLISGGATTRLLDEVKRLQRFRSSSDEPFDLV